jgi:hypothetical protein
VNLITPGRRGEQVKAKERKEGKKDRKKGGREGYFRSVVYLYTADNRAFSLMRALPMATRGYS